MLIWITSSGLTVEFAKGYEGLIPGLIGLIPLGVAVIVNLILGLPNLGFLRNLNQYCYDWSSMYRYNVLLFIRSKNVVISQNEL